jgi:thiopurine S-methyltransferase
VKAVTGEKRSIKGPMDPDFWLDAWERGQTAFHLSEPNPLLVAHWHEVGAAPGDAVLVPLCGRSLDLLWLRDQGARVFGVELSPLAVDEFFSRAELRPTCSPVGSLTRYDAGDVHIYCGDFFDLDPEDAPAFSAAYDRAALIALPDAPREQYASRLSALLPPGARVLLVAFEYVAGNMDGPPFSVPEAEVRRLYESTFSIETLSTSEPQPAHEAFVARGLRTTRNAVYKLVRKP